jgi:hypothetical protein
MLRLVKLADRFTELERSLPDDWAEAQLVLTVTDDARCDRAAALLAPANPGRSGKKIRFAVTRRGATIGPEAVRRLLRRIDAEGITGELGLARIEEVKAEHGGVPARMSLREAWEHALASLPQDWSDLYAEVRLDSTDYIELAALLLSPANSAHFGDPNTLRFRCARRFGYGVSPEMAARCLARCDERGITGIVTILRVLSDTYPVATQGPVWYVGGRSV